MAESKKLKVCIITGTFPPFRCGIGDYTYRLVEAIGATEQLELAVLTSTTQQAAPPLPSVAVYPEVVDWRMADFRPILKRLLDLKPEIVHYQYPTAVYKRKLLITFLPWLVILGFLLHLRRPPRNIVTIHEYSSFRRLGKLRIWLMVLPARKIICLSPATVHALRWLKLVGKQLTFIPLGSNLVSAPPPAYTENPSEWQAEHGLAQDKPIVAYFGFVSPSKGLDILVEAFSQLTQPAQLLLIAEPQAQDSSYGDYVSRIEELIKKSPQAIKWTGFAAPADVAAYLQSATVAALPFTDGVSVRRTSLMAALLNGVATVSTAPNDALEAADFQHGENIWLVPAQNPAALLASLEKLLADAALREKLARNGKIYAAKFDWENISRRHLEVYRN